MRHLPKDSGGECRPLCHRRCAPLASGAEVESDWSQWNSHPASLGDRVRPTGQLVGAKVWHGRVCLLSWVPGLSPLCLTGRMPAFSPRSFNHFGLSRRIDISSSLRIRPCCKRLSAFSSGSKSFNGWACGAQGAPGSYVGGEIVGFKSQDMGFPIPYICTWRP